MENHSRSAAVVLFVSMLCGLLLAGGTTTSINAQTPTKPDNISAFYGTWQGTWSRDDYSGGATMKISPGWGVDTAQIQGTLYGGTPSVISFRVSAASFSEGELVAYKHPNFPEGEPLDDPRNITLLFKFNGENSLQGFYRRGSLGKYQLTRSR